MTPSRQKLTQNAYALYEAIDTAHRALTTARGMGDVARALKILDEARQLVLAPPKPLQSFRMTRGCATTVEVAMRNNRHLRGYVNGLEIKPTRSYLRVPRERGVLTELIRLFHELSTAAGSNKVKSAFSRLESEAREAAEHAPAALELLAYESD